MLIYIYNILLTNLLRYFKMNKKITINNDI